MFPYFWGGVPVSGSAGQTFTTMLEHDLGLRDLPREVREALEDRKEEIHSAEDLRFLANEMIRQKQL